VAVVAWLLATDAGRDTNGGVSSWSLQTVSVGGSSSGWAGMTAEIRAAASHGSMLLMGVGESDWDWRPLA
jgi:hypothetical protein